MEQPFLLILTLASGKGYGSGVDIRDEFLRKNPNKYALVYQEVEIGKKKELRAILLDIKTYQKYVLITTTTPPTLLHYRIENGEEEVWCTEDSPYKDSFPNTYFPFLNASILIEEAKKNKSSMLLKMKKLSLSGSSSLRLILPSEPKETMGTNPSHILLVSQLSKFIQEETRQRVQFISSLDSIIKTIKEDTEFDTTSLLTKLIGFKEELNNYPQNDFLELKGRIDSLDEPETNEADLLLESLCFEAQLFRENFKKFCQHIKDLIPKKFHAKEKDRGQEVKLKKKKKKGSFSRISLRQKSTSGSKTSSPDSSLEKEEGVISGSASSSESSTEGSPLETKKKNLKSLGTSSRQLSLHKKNRPSSTPLPPNGKTGLSNQGT